MPDAGENPLLNVMSNESTQPSFSFDNLTPTLFVDFDGTLHRGTGLLDADGSLSLDTGNPIFEFAPLLASLLGPYPKVEIVVTSSWIYKMSLEQIVSYLPQELAWRVVGSTRGYKARFGYMQNGSAKTYIIRSYVFDYKLKHWLAIDDSVYGAYHLSSDFLPLESHLVLLDSKQGIGAPEAQQRIVDWLAETNKPSD
nr:HAD domain-containing protein [Burkholderia multivorans]